MNNFIWTVFCMVSVFWGCTSCYEFSEASSCESLMPKPKPGVDSNISAALTESPFKLTVNSAKYRRNRILKVKLDGGDYNGFILQARQYSTERPSEHPAIIGTFVDVPSTLSTLDCGHGPRYSVSNTIYRYNASVSKRSVEMSWRGPMDDVGSIEFIATVIVGNNYWHPVKSTPLLFSEFPPSLVNCGISQSCYRYSKIAVEESGNQYIVVTNVVKDDVVFIIGGKVAGNSGYVGIGFTNATMPFIDMCVCIKTGPNKVIASHYIRKPNEVPQRIYEELEDAEMDIDEDFVWCRFRRPLKIASTQGADLTYGMTQIFLWGEVETDDVTPVYPEESKLVLISEPWNYTLTKNVVHYIGGSNLAGINWILISAALLATLIELCRM